VKLGTTGTAYTGEPNSARTTNILLILI